jgi:hypothetical protein
MSQIDDQSDFQYIDKPLTEFFDFKKGAGGYKESFDDGLTPLISATIYNNGVTAYVDSKARFSKRTITVERVGGSAFVQLTDYVTVPDDISVLVPKDDYPLSFLFIVATLIRKQSWKYCYGRKLSRSRLKLIEIPLPYNGEGIDFDAMNLICKNTYGWNNIEKILN